MYQFILCDNKDGVIVSLPCNESIYCCSDWSPCCCYHVCCPSDGSLYVDMLISDKNHFIGLVRGNMYVHTMAESIDMVVRSTCRLRGLNESKVTLQID